MTAKTTSEKSEVGMLTEAELEKVVGGGLNLGQIAHDAAAAGAAAGQMAAGQIRTHATGPLK
jgi:hypothetical protein